MHIAEALLRRSWHMHYYKYLCDGSLKKQSFCVYKVRMIFSSALKYIIQNYELNEEASDVYRLVGKWLAETRARKSYSIFLCSKNLFCAPLGFICASFYNFFNCFAHCACGLKCSSRTILEKYLKPAVSLAEDLKMTNKKSIERRSQTHFHLVHYADALFRS